MLLLLLETDLFLLNLLGVLDKRVCETLHFL